MTLHVFVKRDDFFKALGFALGTITAKPGETWPARAYGYLDASLTRHDENPDLDPDEVDFFIYSEEYRVAIMAIFDGAGVERTVLQAAA